MHIPLYTYKYYLTNLNEYFNSSDFFCQFLQAVSAENKGI